ncbi:hypothetical protein QJS04_geneDACA014228 [Acorus gramineus]|uniref:Uncharacterized protein n=1 Tax=Acorus gramineus TaxID=55184 RepID=A0AAV9BVM9_ACOGR|nr:hypothetical protein QJS04_geneDACA014228 [Acorus gramineus]
MSAIGPSLLLPEGALTEASMADQIGLSGGSSLVADRSSPPRQLRRRRRLMSRQAGGHQHSVEREWSG